MNLFKLSKQRNVYFIKFIPASDFPLSPENTNGYERTVLLRHSNKTNLHLFSSNGFYCSKNLSNQQTVKLLHKNSWEGEMLVTNHVSVNL